MSKIAGSVISAASENTLALASLKFDFSLMKVEAPLEFQGLGIALSPRRRTDAEAGMPHRTARRLGALFEQLIPSTPNLITAYGIRSSDIMGTPGVNWKDSARYGPFEGLVGVDAMAMWAAATSGISALGVYLLACLLARVWEAKEAISIWVELVAERKKEIGEGYKTNHTISASSLVGAQQDISRNDLAAWDASARAWLRSADQAKHREKIQLMLIIKNVQLPFNGGTSTYAKVIASWRQAMITLENLLSGIPQEISSSAVLFAFSAWHIFPDLIVLGEEIKSVKFADGCVHSNGVGTIAFESSFKDTDGPKWFLTLSHLRYYGGPIKARSKTDFSRITINQLHLVALGGILSTWEIRPRDYLSVAEWFTRLWDHLRQVQPNEAIDLLVGLDWLKYLTQAARSLLQAEQGSESFQLVSYGCRHASLFLGSSSDMIPPFLGLARRSILAGLAETNDEERVITALRERVKESGMQSGDGFIFRNWRPVQAERSITIMEVATAVPHTRVSRKRDMSGNCVSESVHARWFLVREEDGLYKLPDPTRLQQVVKRRMEYYNMLGEQATQLLQVPDPSTGFACCPSTCSSSVARQCFVAGPESTYLISASMGSYKLYTIRDFRFNSLGMELGTIKVAGEDYLHPAISSAWFRENMIRDVVLVEYLRCVTRPRSGHRILDPENEVVEKNAREEASAESSPGDYLQEDTELTTKIEEDFPETSPQKGVSFVEELITGLCFSRACVWGLNAMVLATQVYKTMDGATISLKIFKTSLAKASWLSRRWEPPVEVQLADIVLSPGYIPSPLPRMNTFACIAHFETGISQFEPEDFHQTLAIASENSLYVTGKLLSDPFDTIAENDVRFIVGNVGRTGLCLLIAPVNPEIRSLGDEYNLVNHAP